MFIYYIADAHCSKSVYIIRDYTFYQLVFDYGQITAFQTMTDLLSSWYSPIQDDTKISSYKDYPYIHSAIVNMSNVYAYKFEVVTQKLTYASLPIIKFRRMNISDFTNEELNAVPNEELICSWRDVRRGYVHIKQEGILKQKALLPMLEWNDYRKD